MGKVLHPVSNVNVSHPQSTCQHHSGITIFVPSYDYGNIVSWPACLSGTKTKPGWGWIPELQRFTSPKSLPDDTCPRHDRGLLKFQERLFKVGTPDVESE